MSAIVLALSIPDAGPAVGYSEAVIKRAINNGDLVPSYANTKPVITVKELERWLDTLPAEPVRRPRTAA